jgi:hypothetical protein
VLQGTIQVSWEYDYRISHSYDLDETKYTPHGDINDIAVCKLGDKFGADDEMFDSDEDGTWVKTNANYSIFTWDHGKFSRLIRHASDIAMYY